MANQANAILIEVRENESEIAAISEAAAKILQSEHNIKFSNPVGLPTVVYTFLKATMQHLAQNKTEGEDSEINLFQLLDIGISYREGEDGEKDGNFTPYAVPGQEFKLIVKDDENTED